MRFSIGKDWLDRYFGEHKTAYLLNKLDPIVVSHQPISAETLSLIWRLAAWSSSAELKLLTLHSLALNILANELDKLFINQQPYSNQLSRHDKLMANRARDILLSEYKTPPSIAELSKRVGTNPFKLKCLFHQMFNNTPYNLLTEYRMNQAYLLLETAHSPVSVVAHLVGYNHASNFTSAFKRHFGIPPKAVSQNNPE